MLVKGLLVLAVFSTKALYAAAATAPAAPAATAAAATAAPVFKSNICGPKVENKAWAGLVNVDNADLRGIEQTALCRQCFLGALQASR